jgi:hypothetical protein
MHTLGGAITKWNCIHTTGEAWIAGMHATTDAKEPEYNRGEEKNIKKNTKHMKLIKTNTKTNNATIKEAFKVGDTVKWGTNSFDGRVSEWITFTGTVVKVNRRTVDVERDNGNVYRLEAFVHIRTGEWTLA